jgi:hypothetical protein
MTPEYAGEVEELPPDSRMLSGQRYRKYLYYVAYAAIWTTNIYFFIRSLLILSAPNSSWRMWLMLVVEGLFTRKSYPNPFV